MRSFGWDEADFSVTVPGEQLVPDLITMLLLPVFLIAVFHLPVSNDFIRQYLAFNYSTIVPSTFVTSHFVHLTRAHLLGNIHAYLLVMYAWYTLAFHRDSRAAFRRTYLLVLMFAPVGLAFGLLARALFAPNVGGAIAYGSSGLIMAFFGAFTMEVFKTVSDAIEGVRHHDSPLVFFAATGAVCALLLPAGGNGYLLRLGIVALALVIGYLVQAPVSTANIGTVVKEVSNHQVVLGVMAVSTVYVLFVGMFPAQVFVRENLVVNVYIHWLGFAVGFLIAYLRIPE